MDDDTVVDFQAITPVHHISHDLRYVVADDGVIAERGHDAGLVTLDSRFRVAMSRWS